jgi:hypothetical protein
MCEHSTFLFSEKLKAILLLLVLVAKSVAWTPNASVQPPRCPVFTSRMLFKIPFVQSYAHSLKKTILMQLILVTHPRTGDQRDSLKHIYNLYVEYVVKNPLYAPGAPIK